MANLIPGHHILYMDDKGNPQKDYEGNLYLYNAIDNQLCVTANYEDSQFFNVSSDEHSSASSASINVPLSVQECDDLMISKKSVSIEMPIKSKSQEIVKWKDENVVKALIKLWQDYESLFKSSTMKNAEVWRMISKNLREINSDWIFNPVQCENKFKDLRRHYMATKNHNAQTGVQPNTCKFYNEMEEILSMKPSVKPVAIASSLKRRSSALQTNRLTSESEETSTETCDSDNDNQEIKVNKKEKSVRKKTKMERELEAWSLTNQAEAQKKEEAQEKRHQENMEKKEKCIKVYETFMSKLLDKL